MSDAVRFHFTKIRVADLETQFAFYSSVFDRVEKYRVSNGEGADALNEIIMTTPEGDEPALVLIHYVNVPVPPPGSAVIGFRVTDLDAVVNKAREYGGTVTKEPYALPEHGLRVAFVADPEGHVLEIFQPT